MTTTTPYSASDIAAAVARGQAAANDRPQPGLNAGRAAQEYAALAQDFRQRLGTFGARRYGSGVQQGVEAGCGNGQGHQRSLWQHHLHLPRHY